MQVLNEYMYIKGVTSDQKVFRPSDWAERLASLSSIFYPDKHIEYILMMPCCYEGVVSLKIDKSLQQTQQSLFQFLMSFAKDNDLEVITDPILKDLDLNTCFIS